jgi:uncharacterized LabA/DUF88 family protein
MMLQPKPQRSSLSAYGDRLEELEELPRLQVIPNLEAIRPPVGLKHPSADRIAIFINGFNLFYAALQLNIEIDYIKLLHQLTQGRSLLRAYFYTGFDPKNEKQQGFLLWMRRNGYRVTSKELIQFADGSKKANLDVEMAIDMMRLGRYCDAIVLLSGDGDLTYAVEYVSDRGTRVEVVSLRSMTSDRLLEVADTYTNLEAIQQDIQILCR